MKKHLIFGFLFLLLALGIVSVVLMGKVNTEGTSASVSGISGSTIIDIPGERLLIDKEKSSFEFEGFALGGIKSHVGSFDDWTGNLILEDGKIIGFEGTINPSSVNTGIQKLNSDLQSDNFFDVQNFGEIKFKSDSLELESGSVEGQLTFRGITKEIMFPVKISENGDEISGEFFLDIAPFNFKYVGINDEVRIKFDFFANEK